MPKYQIYAGLTIPFEGAKLRARAEFNDIFEAENYAYSIALNDFNKRKEMRIFKSIHDIGFEVRKLCAELGIKNEDDILDVVNNFYAYYVRSKLEYYAHLDE